MCVCVVVNVEMLHKGTTLKVSPTAAMDVSIIVLDTHQGSFASNWPNKSISMDTVYCSVNT